MYKVLRWAGQSVKRNSSKMWNSLFSHGGSSSAGQIKQAPELPHPSGGEGTLDPAKVDENTELVVLDKNNKPLKVISLASAKAKYGDSFQLYQDSNGNVFMNRPTFENHVKSFGQGKCSSVLELQGCAKVLDKTIEIEDLTGELCPESVDGKILIHGASGSPDPNRGVYKIQLTKDEDGNRHFRAVTEDGTVLDFPQAEGEQNTCLYQSLEALRSREVGGSGADPHKLVKQVQERALNSTTLKVTYDNCYELYLDLEFGKTGVPRDPFIEGADYMNRHTIPREKFEEIMALKDPAKIRDAVEAYMHENMNVVDDIVRDRPRPATQRLTMRRKHTILITSEEDHLQAVQPITAVSRRNFYFNSNLLITSVINAQELFMIFWFIRFYTGASDARMILCFYLQIDLYFLHRL